GCWTSRQTEPVRAAQLADRTKPQRLVKACGRGVARAQTQRRKSAAGGGERLGHQRAGHAVPTRLDEHVEMAHTADALVARVWIDVEPAHAGQALSEPGAEERLAGPIEAVGAVVPLVD